MARKPYDETKHPREPKGSGKGGKFAVKPGESGSTSSLPSDGGVVDYLTMVGNLQRDQMAKGGHTGETPASFMLKYGKAYAFDADSYKGKRGKQHMCYKNAGQMALDNSNLTYVEGYVSVHGVPVEHAWLVGQNNKVIDPTLAGAVSDQAVKGYFGVPVKTSYLSKTILRTRQWGVFGYTNMDRYLSDPPEDIVA